MVSSLLADALEDPTELLLELFDPTTTSLDDFPTVVSRHFSDIFKNDDAFQEIPTLDVNHPPDAHSSRSLVSLRAMVQDTSLSPEMYLAKRTDGTCGGWGLADNAQTGQGTTNYDLLRECTVVWAVNVPGESPWCSQEANGTNNTNSNLPHKPPQPHKFPVANTPHVGVQVKIYANGGAESLKATDILTFVGILTSEPWHRELESSINVPTLHVLFSRRLSSTIVPRSYPATVDLSAVREELITWVAEEALGGDRDAAEWVLLTSIARVQSRTPPILPPSLTLSRFPSPSTLSEIPTLFYVLTELFPICSLFPLSLATLNRENFLPESKDEDLHSGLLQMPAGTSFLVTETGLQEGKLVEKGIMNVRAIQEAISSQTVDYVFPFSRFPFPMDATFIVLSEGRKSAFFQTSVTLPLQQTGSPNLFKSRDQVKLPSPERLASFRLLVGGAKSGSVGVGEVVAEHIQEDFVSERKENKSVTTDDFILRMTMAKLLALSMHEKEVSIDIWQRVKALDENRQARII